MKPIQKTIKSREECYIEFTDEEMAKLNIAPGDKFSWKEQNGGFLLEKYVPVEIDFSSFDKETLLFLISESCEKDKTIAEIITEVLENVIKSHE